MSLSPVIGGFDCMYFFTHIKITSKNNNPKYLKFESLKVR